MATASIAGYVPGKDNGTLQSLKTRFKKYRLYRRTVSELSALSNHTLTDLGLTRNEIKRVAWQAAYSD